MKRLQQYLVDHGYDLGNFGPNKNGVDGDAGSKTKSALTSFIKAECSRLGYIFFQKNIYWIRMSDDITDKFSDFGAVVINGKVEYVFPATTKPGKYWIQNPLTVGGITGTGCQKEGQFIGSHKFIKTKSKWNALPYFKQIGQILVYRDGNKDNKLDTNIVQKAPAWYSFHLHSMGKGFSIWNWSAGCLGSPRKYWAQVVKYFSHGDVINNTIFEL